MIIHGKNIKFFFAQKSICIDHYVQFHMNTWKRLLVWVRLCLALSCSEQNDFFVQFSWKLKYILGY